MPTWSALDERVAYIWWAVDERRRHHRVMAQETARVMEEVAETRRDIARVYDEQADRATGSMAMHLRSRARYFDDLATRAMQFAKKEEAGASRGRPLTPACGNDPAAATHAQHRDGHG